ncbi:MAG: hypothetical protein LBS94_00625, partial [Prevotellaceae bacterium]|nr:hypothetical protein [Prevotellaceae bacterium]
SLNPDKRNRKRSVVVSDSAELVTVKVFKGDGEPLKLVYEGQFTDEKSYERWSVVADNFRIPLLDNFIGRGDEKKPAKKTKKGRSKMEGHYAGFGFGLANVTSKNLSSTTSVDGLTVDPARCYEWTFNIFDATIPIVSPYLGLVSGFGLDWRNFRFEDTQRLQKDADGTVFLADDPNGITYSKSRLRTLHLTVPLLLEWQPLQKFYVSAGVVGGWNVMASNKLIWDNGDRKHESTTMSGWKTNPLSLDAMVKVGFHGISAYGKYSPTTLFQSGKGPQVHVASVGLMIDF